MGFFNYSKTELDYLRRRDKRLGRAIDQIGIIERPVTPDLFTALVSSIISQQISAKAAVTVRSRLQERLGAIIPETIASASVEEIQQCGLSTRKAGYIKGIGMAIVQEELNLSSLHELSDEEVIAKLSALKGVGTWTAEMLLIFSMERPDVVSWDDLAIRRGIMKHYGHKTLTREQFERYRKRYSPYGSVASLYLWAVSHT